MSWWRRGRRWSISSRSIPNNPRSIVFQLARIETHLAALPKRGEENRLSPPEQIATAAATRCARRTPPSSTTQALLDVEAALMKLSDVVASTYFTTHARSEAHMGGARMIYDVRQETTYHYASTVAYARHVLRLEPDRPPGPARAGGGARCRAGAGRAPRRAAISSATASTWVALDQPHDKLTVRVAARVVVDRPAAVDPAATPPWEEVRAAAFASADLSPQSPAHFLFPSRQVSLDPEIRDYAAVSFPPGRPVLDGAIDLMLRIKTEFVYEIGATTASTTPPMSFALRRGVCQDFSHIMISGMRSLGIPAAYVSGYLRTVQSPAEVKLAGADAMHAWVLVWCGAEAGWIGLDPTNGILAGNDHVVLAIGRDYADVAPIDGVIFASGGQRLEVAVRVAPVA